MTSRTVILLAALITLHAAFGCTSTPRTASEAQADFEALDYRARAVAAGSRAEDPGIKRFYERSAGYAIFPNVGKGGFIVGGAHGRGVVYRNSDGQGSAVGTATLTQGSVGLQIGGQSFDEIIFFERPIDLERFKRGNLELAAEASAVVAESGGSAKAAYHNGVAVFIRGEVGLMAEASVGGQKFAFTPMR